MKVLFLHTTALFPLQFGALLDEAEIMSRDNCEVYFAYCKKATNFCSVNLTGKKSNCDLCTWTTNHALNNLSKDIKLINILDYCNLDNNHRTFSLNSVDEIKAIDYKQVKIGYGVLSTYISFTRNNDPVFDEAFVSYINKLLNTSILLTDAYEKIYEQINPDLICIFNGRYFEFRPAYELAINKCINVKCYEVIGDYGKDGYKLCYDNCMPHSILGNMRKVEEEWNSCELSESEKLQIGSSFYINRRQGRPAGDKIYTINQKAGLLPIDWDESKRNFVIFNSSEDECVSVGDEYSRFNFFKTQIEGIKNILTLLIDHKDIHIYLRIHPNLSEIKYSYHTDLLRLDQEFPNVTIISGKDNVSSYELMERSEKVIVFGSTMGFESAFWKKPVINLAGCDYAMSNICYMPQSEEDLKHLLLDKLFPRDSLFAVQYGFFKMHREDKNKFKFIDFNYRLQQIMNKEFCLINYQKILGSRSLFAFAQKIIGHYFSIIDKSKATAIPTQGKQSI